ncbi:MAG: penicillin-binding protein activator [Gammaproteobacteria bacterium]
MVEQIVQVRTRSVLGWLGAVALVGVMAGCAVTRPTGNATAAQAQRMESRGNYKQAGAAWLEAAKQARGQARAAARLNAATDYEKANDLASAWEAVAPLDIAALAPNRQLAGARTKARLALATHRPKPALAALAAAPAATNIAAQAEVLALAGRAHFAADDPATGLKELVQRGRLVANDPQQELANNQLLWGLLIGTTALPSATGLSPVTQGWITLAQIWRTAWEQPKQFASQLAAWRSAYPEHPANQGLVAEIVAEEKARLSYPGQVALLLPLTGPNAAQARAVEAGILAAYYRVQSSQPTLMVYDTGGSANGARKALAKATAAGADFVLGPLTVPGAQGAASAAGNTPELALNYLPGQGAPPTGFFQFGLSPEQEARTSAEQAVAQGLSRAVVLVPDNDWGAGIAAAFTRNLTLLGGQVLASTTFPAQSEHFSAALSAAFGLDASTQREQHLSAVLGQPLGFTPHRRQDIQFVFFAAPYGTALLIPSQIAYNHGLGLSMYSISNVYQPGANVPDLDGVHFPVMPWFLADTGALATTRNQLAKLHAQNWGQFAPLYGLGYDAWRLLPLLAHAEHPLAHPVRGVTGALSMGTNQVIQRRADPARYRNGVLAPVAATAP